MPLSPDDSIKLAELLFDLSRHAFLEGSITSSPKVYSRETQLKSARRTQDTLSELLTFFHTLDNRNTTD